MGTDANLRKAAEKRGCAVCKRGVVIGRGKEKGAYRGVYVHVCRRNTTSAAISNDTSVSPHTHSLTHACGP